LGIVIITGGIDSGKTTWCIENLVEGNAQIDGVLSLKVFRHTKRIGYDILRAKTGERFPLARLRGCIPLGCRERLELGIFSFCMSAFRKAEEWFEDIGPMESFVIDEVGHLELKGEGFHDLAVSILGKRHLFENIYLVVRKSLVESVAFDLNISDYTLIDVEQPLH